MIKQLLHRLFLIALLAALAPAAYARYTAFIVDGVCYSISDSTAHVTCRSYDSSAEYDWKRYNYKESYTGSIVIPSTVTINGVNYEVTTINDNAFRNCSKLTSITIPNSVTSIGENAFYKCTGLASITIPNSVTNIRYNVFVGCTGLTAINVDEDNKRYSSVNGIVYTKDIDTLVICPAGLTSSITIPNSVTRIGYGAFKDCLGLTSITIPNSVTSIGENAFSNCTNLWSIGNYVATCSTITLPIKTWGFNGADYGVNGVKGNNKITGCSSGKLNYICLYLILSNGTCCKLDEYNYYTSAITPTITATSSPTTISGTVSYYKGDAIETIKSEAITAFNETIKGESFSKTGLDPNTSYTVTYSIKLSDERTLSTSKTIKTDALTLTTLKPKVVSSSCAIAAATTNISEDETNAGFQWRKYEAPSTLASNEGYAAIYDGQLEGYIKNLQSTSFYNVRAFYKSASDKYYYGDWVTFDPSDFSYFEPTVHTYDAINVTDVTAKVKGYVMQGTDDVTEQGFEYWKVGSSNAQQKHAELMATSATASDGVSVVLTTGQVMTAVLEGLEPSTTYVFRAFVKTASGTTYGEEQTFTTAVSTGIESVVADVSDEMTVTASGSAQRGDVTLTVGGRGEQTKWTAYTLTGVAVGSGVLTADGTAHTLGLAPQQGIVIIRVQNARGVKTLKLQ